MSPTEAEDPTRRSRFLVVQASHFFFSFFLQKNCFKVLVIWKKNSKGEIYVQETFFAS